MRWAKEAVDDYESEYEACPYLESKGVGPAGEQAPDGLTFEQIDDSTPLVLLWFSILIPADGNFRWRIALYSLALMPPNMGW